MKITKKKIFLIFIAVFLAGSFFYFKYGRKPKTEYTTVKAERGNLIQTVSQTGTVKSPSEVNLNFLNSGVLAKKNVDVGATVKKGQVLAELDYSQLSMKADEAEANLLVANANLEKTLNGGSSQDDSVSRANYAEAQTAYDSALAELEKIKATVNENVTQTKKNLDDLSMVPGHDPTTYEQALKTAQSNLDNAKKTYGQTLDNKMDSALSSIGSQINASEVALDSINKVLTDPSANAYLSAQNNSFLLNTKTDYGNGKNLIAKSSADLTDAENNKTYENISAASNDVSNLLNTVSDGLDNCYKALENSYTGSTFPQSLIDTYKTDISAQETIISGGISALQIAQQSLDDANLAFKTNVESAQNGLDQASTSLANALTGAQNNYNSAVTNGNQSIQNAQSKVDSASKALAVSQLEFDRTTSPARAEDVLAARAQVNEAQAQLDYAQAQIDNSVIKAPIDGIISAVNYEVGENVTPDTPVITMLNPDDLEAEVLVSEADIAKIAIGQNAEITFDAFGDGIKFAGQVYFIDPASTMVQDVVYYRVKTRLTDRNQIESENNITVKPGMTANLTITTAEKDNVVSIPSRAVIENADGSEDVRILKPDGTVEERPVKTGLRGDEGMVEIVSGVNEGDNVITYVQGQ